MLRLLNFTMLFGLCGSVILKIKKKENKEGINIKKSENFSEWYTQIIKKADLVDYSKVSGCLVFKPSSFVLWESAKEYFKRLYNCNNFTAIFP